jgi:phosphatidylinositol alpha-mannosyltransferase
MKVAITHPYSWPEVRRGAERIVAETARALGIRGHDVTVLTAGRSPGREHGGGVATVRYRRVFDDARMHERWFAARITPALARGHFEVVHSLMPFDALAAVATRRIGRHRTVYQEIGNPHGWWWAGIPDGRARQRVVRSVDVYGCMSRYSLRVLEQDWARNGVLIPGGVRLDTFEPARQRAPEPTILFSGALDEPRKHLDTLLAALALLARRVPDVRLLLSGPGEPGAVIAAAPVDSRTRTAILELGAAAEQGDRYARAWVTALPSEGDCFGLALVESLACGTPIVVADDGAPPELVTDGVGAVARVRDPRSLADALERSLDLARQTETVERCRSRAAAFDWDTAIAPLLEEVYARPVTEEASGDGLTPEA